MIKGATLGQYRLERLIHMGDSCQVWEATKLKTNELYALKVLRPDFRASRQKDRSTVAFVASSEGYRYF